MAVKPYLFRIDNKKFILLIGINRVNRVNEHFAKNKIQQNVLATFPDNSSE